MNTEPVVDYYDKYGIKPDDNWKVIKQKLGKESAAWSKRQSTTNEKEVLEQIEKELLEIDKAYGIFNPKNKAERENYDALLERQKQEVKQTDNQINDKKITFQDIGKGTIQEFSKDVKSALKSFNELENRLKEQRESNERKGLGDE